MTKEDITDEEFLRISKNIDKMLFTDLVIWRNELLNHGKIYNRLYELIDSEIKKRRIGKVQEPSVGMKK